MKKLMCFIIVLLAISSAASAAVIAVEDFEDGVVDANLATSGWAATSGSAGNLLTKESTMSGSTSKVGVVDQYLGGYMSRAMTNTLTGTETQVYFKGTLSTSGWGAGGFALYDVNGIKGPVVALIYDGNEAYKKFDLYNIPTETFGVTIPNGVYEIALIITMDSNVYNSTGSVVYRQIDGGDGLWHSAGINNVVLGYTTATVPSAATRLGVYAYGYTDKFDNIELGTGIFVANAVVAVADFEDGVVDANLATSGWIGAYGPASNLVTDTSTMSGSTSKVGRTDNYLGGYLSHAMTNTLNGTETQVYVKGTLSASGSGYGGFALYDANGGISGPVFGLSYMGSNDYKQFDVWCIPGGERYGITVPNGIYEIAMNITMNLSNVYYSTGSVVYRQIDGGDGLWHSAGANLENMVLGYSAGTVPSAAARVGLFAYGYTDLFDNIELGTGIFVKSTVVAVEDFEDGVVDANLAASGWVATYGSATNLLTDTSEMSGSTSKVGRTDNYLGGYLSRAMTNTLTGTETQVYFKGTLSTSGWGDGGFALYDANGIKGPVVALIYDGNESYKKFDLYGIPTETFGVTIPNGVYEIALIITMDSNVYNSTGSVIYRQIDGGDGLWHSAGINNAVLGYTTGTVPSAATRLGLYAYGYTDRFDNIELGIGNLVANTVVESETFETGTVGNNLTADGWAGATNPNYCVFKTETPYTALGKSDNTSKIGAANTPPCMAYKPFDSNSTNPITDADTDVYMKTTLYMGYMYQWVAPHIGGESGTAGPVFGEDATYWEIWRADNSNETHGGSVTFGDYEVVLQMSINPTSITSSTGTLYYRLLGTTTWTKDPNIQNVNLGLTSTNKPSLWDSWFMRGGYNGGFDNLQLGVGFGPEILKAYQPWPWDGEECIKSSTTMRWMTGSYADHWNVYLGTSSSDVNNATTISSEYKGQVNTNTYSATGLTAGTTYYWRIDAVDIATNWIQKGDVWSFKDTNGILSTDTQQDEIGGTPPSSWPITHVQYYHGEYDVNLFSYNPRFTPGVTTFDANNMPYIITGTLDQVSHISSGSYIQTLDSNGRWIGLDPSQSIYAEYPSWNGVWEVMDRHIVFDDDDDAYMLIWLNSVNLNKKLLLYSRDNCRTWQVYELPFLARIEHRTGHNDIVGPPVIVSNVEYPESYGVDDLKIIIPTKSNGVLTIPNPITIVDKTSDPNTKPYIVAQHSGDGDVVITKGNYTHIVWMTWENIYPYGDGNMPCYAATVTRSTGAVSNRVFLGYANSIDNTDDDHQGPAITIDSSNYLHVVIGAHQNQFKYTKSTSANSTSSWSPSPATVIGTAAVGGYTYPALVCDANDRLFLASRWAGESYYFKVSYMYKDSGGSWNYDHNLMEPYRQYYMCFHQHLNLDNNNRLFLNYDTEYNQLDYYCGGATHYERDNYEARWPEETPLQNWPGYDPNSGLYYTLPHDPVLLMTANGGSTWKLAETSDFLP